jgi:prepilin-type processing-associated H-X9-DG protein
LIGNPRDPNPDNWVEVPNQQSLYWRVPTDLPEYDADPQRAFGRHLRRANAGFADGHAETLRVSAIGLQYFPGKNINGQTATGLHCLGGNGLFDDRWMWSWGS